MNQVRYRFFAVLTTATLLLITFQNCTSKVSLRSSSFQSLVTSNPNQVSSITELINYKIEGVSQVTVAGFYTKGDGGEGVFNLESACSQPIDGGTVFKSVIQSGACWKRDYSGELNLKWFGAHGDGVTDDRAILKTTLGLGKDLFIPTGTYFISETVVLDDLNNMAIRGEGATSILKADGPSIVIQNSKGITVSYLNFQAITQPTVVTVAQLPTRDRDLPIVIDRFNTGKGYMPTVNDGDLYNTSCLGTDTCLVSKKQIAQAFDTGIYFKYVEKVHLNNLQGTYYSIFFFDSSDVEILDSQIHGGKNFTGGIAFWRTGAGSSGSKNIKIKGNTISYVAFSGICLAGVTGAQVISNYVSYVGESGFKMGQGEPEQSSDVHFFDNTSLYSWWDGFDLSTNYPHTATFVANSSAINNISKYNHGTGLWGDGINWTISNNQIIDNHVSGMILDMHDSLISNNFISGNNMAKNPLGDHQLVNGAGVLPHGTTISGNIIQTNGNPGYCMWVVGANTLFDNSCTGSINYISSTNIQK